MKKVLFAFGCLLLILAGAAGLKSLHYYFVMGLNPFMGPLLVIVALLIILPLALQTVRSINRRFQKVAILPSTWFAVGAVIWFALSMLFHFFGLNGALDLHFHDTYVVFSQSFVAGTIAAYLGLTSWLYHTFSLLTGKKVKNGLAYIHFWITFLGALTIFLPLHYTVPLSSMPRRYMDYERWHAFDQYSTGYLFWSVIAVIIMGAQLLLPASLFYDLVSRRKPTAPANHPPSSA
jgi:cytochrome c oxidase subunit 1